MFWIGFACGVAAWFALAIVAVIGFVWLTRNGDPFDDGVDEHADALGIGATHFGGVSK
jgi:hypothetical protein